MPRILKLEKPLDIDVSAIAKLLSDFNYRPSSEKDSSELISDPKSCKKVIFLFYGKTKEGFTEIHTDYNDKEIALLIAKLEPTLAKKLNDALKTSKPKEWASKKLKKSNEHPVEPVLFSGYQDDFFLSMQKRRINKQPLWAGVLSEGVSLHPIPFKSKVLDVGAGNGEITERIRKEKQCDVYALEPCFSKTDYEECVKQLGEDHVYPFSLQDALDKEPKLFEQAFDAVTVFKYNVRSSVKDEFIQSLARVVKPEGLVYITCVSEDCLFFDGSHGKEYAYITDTLNKYFTNVKIDTIRILGSTYGEATCSGPRPEIKSKISASA